MRHPSSASSPSTSPSTPGASGAPEAIQKVAGPIVLVTTDDDLAVGEFGIATRLVADESSAESPPAELDVAQPAHTMIYRAPTAVVDAPPPTPGPAREVVTLTVAGKRHEITEKSVVVGRSREADIRISDVNSSRRHAELRQEGGTFWIVDLGSTNGTSVNGKRVDRQRLRDGDRIEIGTTEIVFGRSLSKP